MVIRASIEEHYKDSYGGRAALYGNDDGSWTLIMASGFERTEKTYATRKGARIAMGRSSDTWRLIPLNR